MAITFDASASGIASGSPLTFNHTTAGSDRLLIVGVVTINSGNAITSVTYNGVVMTQGATITIGAATGSICRTYYLANPASGTNVVSISCSVSTVYLGVSASFNGVLQTSPLDTSATDNSTNSGQSSTYAPSISASVANELYIMLIGNPNMAGTLSGASGTTLAVQTNVASPASRIGLFYKVVTASGSNTMNGSNSVVLDYGLNILNFKPTVPVSVNGAFLINML